MKLRWYLVGLPALLGLGGFIAVWYSQWRELEIYVQLRLGFALLMAGLTFSVILGVSLSVWEWVQHDRQVRADETAEDRRRFLRRLDHELKNPLTAILAGLANLKVAPAAAIDEGTLDSVSAQVGRLRRLVAELRKLSDLESRPLEHEPIDLNVMLEEVFSLNRDREDAETRQFDLSIPRAPWPLPTIQGDRDLLVLALHNLLDNAIKFTNPGDTVEVRAFEDGSSVVIEIADTGPGIPAVEVPHIWEELYRGDGARGVPGSGLGLALVRAIITRHNGQINLRSRADQGTVFIVRLPAG